MQRKKNRYAVIFCSPTETETYRNRKFDPETEISASGSTFGFVSAQPLLVALITFSLKDCIGPNVQF